MVLSAVDMAIGHPVRCSTATNTKRFPDEVAGKGPAKSIEKTLNKLEIRRRMVVLYLGIGRAFRHPS